MNDEILQINNQTFNRIVLALVLLGGGAGGAIFFTGGFSSPWFVICASLLVLTLIAFGIKVLGRLVVASYVLALELAALAAATVLRFGVDGIAPYFFIPVVLVTGLLLNPTFTIITAVSLIALALVLLFVTQPAWPAALAFLLPSLGLTALVALLGAQNKHNMTILSDRLIENRVLLRERALELMKNLKYIEALEQKAQKLQKELNDALAASGQLQAAAVQENNQLYALVKGTIAELNQSIAALEYSIEKIGGISPLNGYSEVVELAWQKLHHLKSLVVNLESMAQIDRAEFKLSLETVDMAQLVSEVAGTARGLAREKKLQVRYHVAENLPPVNADPAMVRQVLLQLISNAIKFTDRGIIEIRGEVDQNQLVVFVSDTGVGMSGEEAELAFKKFGRSGNLAIQERQGVGLGLAICKRLIELHSGRMWVSSMPGVGSTFYFSLPLDPYYRQLRAPVTVVSSGKTTVRVDNSRQVPAVKSGVALPVVAASSAEANGATMVLPQPQAPSQTDDMLAAKAMLAAPIQPAVRTSRHTQPIHRYQPLYIQRFGYILLGLLLVVLLVGGGLATANYLDVASPAVVVLPTAKLTTATATVTAAVVEVAAAAPTATPLPLPTFTTEPTSTLAPMPTATVTPLPATATSTSTATPLPTFTSTPVPTETPTPPATATATATNTPVPAQPTPTTVIALPTPARLTLIASSVGNAVLPASDNSRAGQSATGQIVFTGNQAGQRDIMIIPAAGATPVNLTGGVGDNLQPDWSPDGRRIVFSSGRTGSFNIFTMNADGSNLTQLTSTFGFDEWPVWSPAGRQIAFVSDRDGNEEIYVMNTDGGNQRRLTTSPADNWPVAWSPDGRRLVFASNRDGNWNLYIINAGGGPDFRLTNAPGDERDPIWSPDGTTIAFVANGGGNFDVYTLPAPAGAVAVVAPGQWTRVTTTPTDERYPTWAQVK